MSLRDDYVRHLETENEILHARIAVLEEALCGKFNEPFEWKLTGKERAVFGVLFTRELATKDALMAALYRDSGSDEAELKIIDVFVCKLRKKLKPWNIQISTKWGEGYFLTNEAKARVRELLQPMMVAA